jgi:hypothetical protein
LEIKVTKKGELRISKIIFGSKCTPVSSTNIIDHHDITDILLKAALNTIILIQVCEILEFGSC